MALCSVCLQGSQQPFVARPGSGDAVLPFIHTEDESRTTVSQSAEPATAAPVSEPRPSESWDSWLRTFERLDKACEQQAFLKQRLQVRTAPHLVRLSV